MERPFFPPDGQVKSRRHFRGCFFPSPSGADLFQPRLAPRDRPVPPPPPPSFPPAPAGNTARLRRNGPRPGILRLPCAFVPPPPLSPFFPPSPLTVRPRHEAKSTQSPTRFRDRLFPSFFRYRRAGCPRGPQTVFARRASPTKHPAPSLPKSDPKNVCLLQAPLRSSPFFPFRRMEEGRGWRGTSFLPFFFFFFFFFFPPSSRPISRCLVGRVPPFSLPLSQVLLIRRRNPTKESFLEGSNRPPLFIFFR